jgi:NAD(P)-dependent dehydrogenase (short-subunit alcohol dehydrogenase family)
MGRALCELVASRGEHAVAVDRDTAQLDWTENVDGVAAYVADISADESNEGMVAFAVEQFGGVDAVALNAGIDMVATIDDMSMDELDHLLSINLRGVVLGVRAALPALRQRGGGAIVITSSMGGIVGQVGRSAYGIAKAGVINLAKTVALEVGHEGIRINAVCPGPIRDTGLSRGVETRAPEAYRRYANRTALKRYGTAEEVAAVMDFLLSPAASYVTGTAVVVDGGFTAGQALDQPRGNL